MTLRHLYVELRKELESLGVPIEVIFVEDCGGDGSWAIIEALAAEDERFRGIRLNRNFGQHNALLCGIRTARNEVVVTMDDDLQHPVSEIRHLLR